MSGEALLTRRASSAAPWIAGGVAVVGAHAAAGLLFQFANPYETQVFPECFWHQMTGWECPTCGGTRALYSLLRGDLSRSFAMNPLLIVSYVAGLLLIGQTAVERLMHRQVRWPLWVAVSLVGVAAIYTGILRNVW
ncbi:DUF2752 domain-containing protein [Microbacterium sp. NPDC076895]|uniref:DUF2752 domain-containing protein n=1 Tax=Microbacterium sp. NPDC076895 TaxID=3154957 RepID=UPI003428036B